MNQSYLNTEVLPFCKGCSHSMITRNVEKALEKIAVDPLDVVIVTDIGCHGIIDNNFYTHTVHGLHGRSVALGAGISAALSNPHKKVIVFIGDGGSTIGLNHLLGAAHRNFDMTVVVFNNMLYGMTGGQPSDLTPSTFSTRGSMAGFTDTSLDLHNIVLNTGAAYVSRVVARGDFSSQLAEAFQTHGFSFVEVLEICPSYGLKYNKDINMKNIETTFNLALTTHKRKDVKPVKSIASSHSHSLLDTLDVVPAKYAHQLETPLSMVIGGSAGEGVQVAADIFARAAMSSGLNVTKKGSYPVTVGIGFSAVEINLSHHPIEYTGIREIDWAIITSEDGLNHYQKYLEKMTSGYILFDETITGEKRNIPAQGVEVLKGSFRQLVGAKESLLLALAAMLEYSKIFPVQAFFQALAHNKIGDKVDIERFKSLVKEIVSGYRVADSQK